MKTREQQIQEQAELSFNGKTEQATIFAQGARWADHYGQHLFVILRQVESDQDNMQGLWDGISTRYFRSYEQAAKYAAQFPHAYKQGKYNIAEIEPYHPSEYDLFEEKRLHNN